MTTFTFNTAGAIVFGEGAIGEIGALAAKRLGRRVLLVTDAGVVKAELVEPALRALKAAGVEGVVYAEVVGDPPEALALAATRAAVEAGATGVIGLGGGSSLDVAKIVALLAVGKEALPNVYGVGKALGPRLPLLLAPTTAGTGSEVTPIAILTTGRHEKMGVVSPVLLPDVALLDPELTLGLPPHVTAATGIDAMVHAIEAYASASANNNPISRALACKALSLMGGALERAVHDGADRRVGPTCCSAPCWRDRPSPIRPSPPSMRSPIRSAAISTWRMGSPTPSCCRMSSASTRRRRRRPMSRSRRWRSLASPRSPRPHARTPSRRRSPISRAAAACRSACATSAFRGTRSQ